MTDQQPLTAFGIQEPPLAQQNRVGSRIASGIDRATKGASVAAHQTRSLFGLDRQGPSEPAQPESNDPNDPRNWSEKHKHITYLTICLFSFMANVNASNFTVAVVPLTQAFKITTTQATALTALNVLTFGLGNLLWVPLMRIIGKRPIYLISLLILIITNAWSCTATSWVSLLAARMCSGIGASAADATVPNVVSDLWPIDQRGRKMMFFAVALGSGIFLGPIINAWVVQLHGWRWSPGWMAIVFGFIFVLALFLIHETEYRRERKHFPPEWIPPQRKFSGYLSLKLGLEPHQPAKRFLRTLKDILVMTLYPQLIWSALLVGVFVGWTIIIQVTLGQNFSNPRGTYRWPLGITGLMHFAGWIGAMLSYFAGGWLLDRMYRGRKQRAERKGKLTPGSQAHFRLPGLIIPFLIAPVGLLVYGISLAKQAPWPGYAFGYALHSFGFVAVSNFATTYLIDCFTQHGGESLVSFFIIRNAIAVLCSFEVQSWLGRSGAKGMFGTMAAVEWVVLAWGIVMYFGAGWLRGWTERFGPQRRLVEEKRESGGGEVRVSTRRQEMV
ncbi:hypothetical protein M409DRAFT_20967 [Zasmidium cellare ATCC 36951]|uniref:Major facilitator superfamily (MFS) profile domain-containing protein n=1 Tax=Zasmidium cellare ATCC 36951 TaxID=1080233 RepID=A0A6A6CP88_ZASCE|nr:uncharacterized protein M409DRAFT_20967 [Zasmidium cellare ATCC 36951]KAF2168954.1 hypothetical protein M409DRAFT_20967 [Zasmidium cellare ATCC 36951]